MTQKQCTKCQLVKPLEEFRFLKVRGRHMSECRECERQRGRNYGSKYKRLSRREVAVREVAFLCKMFDTGILQEAVNYLEENPL